MRKLYTLKAGCILIDSLKQQVALIYREKHNDYEFPKGHLENNETLKECAIRETAEESKRDAKVIENISPIEMKYNTKKGEHCKCYYFIAVDNGKSDNSSTDTHTLVWVNFNDTNKILTHKTTKSVWKKALKKIKEKFLIKGNNYND